MVGNDGGIVEEGDIVGQEEPAEDNASVSSSSSSESENGMDDMEDMDNRPVSDENEVRLARTGIIAHDSPLP